MPTFELDSSGNPIAKTAGVAGVTILFREVDSSGTPSDPNNSEDWVQGNSPSGADSIQGVPSFMWGGTNFQVKAQKSGWADSDVTTWSRPQLDYPVADNANPMVGGAITFTLPPGASGLEDATDSNSPFSISNPYYPPDNARHQIRAVSSNNMVAPSNTTQVCALEQLPAISFDPAPEAITETTSVRVSIPFIRDSLCMFTPDSNGAIPLSNNGTNSYFDTGRKAYIVTQPGSPTAALSPMSWSITIKVGGTPTPTVQWQESDPTTWYSNDVENYPTAYSAWYNTGTPVMPTWDGTNWSATLSGSNYRYRLDRYKSFRAVVSNTIGGVAYPVTSTAISIQINPRSIVWSGPNPVNNLSVLPGTPVTCTVSAGGASDLQPCEWRDYWDQYGILAYGNSYTISGVLGPSDGAWKGYCRTVGPDTKWSSSNYTGWIDWKLKP